MQRRNQKLYSKCLTKTLLGPEHREVQLFNAQREVHYCTVSYRHSTENQIEIEPFNDMYLVDFFMEPETIMGLYLDKYFMGNEDGIPTCDMPLNLYTGC